MVLSIKNKKTPYKMLHVEDVDFNYELISMYLEDENIEITSAENGYQALEILKSYTPDIILMDIEMPGLNGYVTTKIIRKNELLKSIPVIAVTSYASDKDIQEYSSVFNDYLTKPLTQNVLLKCLSKYLILNQSVLY